MSKTQNGDPVFKSGFIAIAGAPNTGKSTLLNRMLGQKISITSRKPQTTRNRIIGVVHRPSAQLVFMDTPGVHKARSPLNVKMVDEALSAIAEGDITLALVDVSRPLIEAEEIMVRQFRRREQPVVLALNKIDLIDKKALLGAMETWSEKYGFKAMIPISAKHGTQVEQLLTEMEALLPPGPPYFPEETLTDMPERFVAAEMIREKVFRLTGQEIPYSTAITVDAFSEEKKGKLVKIQATIHVERNSQKGMIIGKKGSKLKAIGEEARKEIERMVGTRVFLKLFVRVQKNWSKDTRAMRKLGY
jgi:GTP-binding protein Era